MGTGNDLSRVIGWGSLEPNHKNIIQYVADIHFCAKITKRWSDLDRWRISYSFDHIAESEEEFCSQIIGHLGHQQQQQPNDSMNGMNEEKESVDPNQAIRSLLKDRTGKGHNHQHQQRGQHQQPEDEHDQHGQCSDIDAESDDIMGEDVMDSIMNDIDCNALEIAEEVDANMENGDDSKLRKQNSLNAEQLNKLFEYAPHEMGGKNRYEIEPPEQWYIQQHPQSKTNQYLQTFDPPLPSTFVK